MFTQQDRQYMARALELAHKGLYTTDPNPRVGCVIVRDNAVVGEGWHQRAGEPHAEVFALRQAGDAALHATAYVTLEPCCHHGRTPPCSQALIDAGVSRVVVAMADPNPMVAGKGLDQLTRAGTTVASGLLQSQAEALNPGFIKRMRTGLPYVRSKLAMSLDGRTALRHGESKWITSADARLDVQRWRARSSVIMTGSGTVVADDPLLTVRPEQWDAAERLELGTLRQPLRVVLDSQLSISADAAMFSAPGITWVMTGSTVDVRRFAGFKDAAVQLIQLDSTSGRPDLHEVMRRLAQDNVNEVLVEAGSTLNGALLSAGLIDELIVYMAPHLMGDAGRGLFHLPELLTMDQRRNLRITDIRAVGQDWRITAIPEY